MTNYSHDAVHLMTYLFYFDHLYYLCFLSGIFPLGIEFWIDSSYFFSAWKMLLPVFLKMFPV